MRDHTESGKAECGMCGAVVLRSTVEACAGLCMQCFMKQHHGYRPAELTALKERGLEPYFERWRGFKEKRVPLPWFGAPDSRLTHYIPLIQASISGHLRFGKGSFDAARDMKFLDELKQDSNGKLKVYLLELEAFVQELTDLTRTRQSGNCSA